MTIRFFNNSGGGIGIRTLAPLTRPAGFQDQSLQPTWVFLHLLFQQQINYSISNYSKSIRY